MGDLRVLDHPLVHHKLTLLRDRSTPTAVFRRVLREVGAILAYEATRDLPTEPVPVETPLETVDGTRLAGRKVALVSVLRAGNGLLDGALDLLPSARVGFVGLYRDEETLEPVQYYLNLPGALAERDVIVVDPMLATGNSSSAAVDLVKASGPRSVRFVALVAAPEGVERFSRQHPDVTILTAALDRELDDNGFILPGLGDAGDRLFGTKV